jgi:ABC-2 type transport system ATP-binding protein
MAEVERLADRVIMLDRGSIVADATPEALISRFGRQTLEEVFLDIARNTQPGLMGARSVGDAG